MENIEKKYTFFRFEDLRIYRKALDYSKWINANTATIESSIPGDHLHLSFVKAASLIAINIAEGSGRNKSQFVYYLKLAKTSICECVVFTTMALDEDYFTQEIYDDSREFLVEISKMLGALISSLQRNRYHDQSEDDENSNKKDDESFDTTDTNL